MLKMFSPCFTIDEDIIKEEQNEFLQVALEYFIQQYLECGRRIHEAKWHDQKIIVVIMYVKSYFRDIILMNPNLVIPKMKIHLGEKMSTMKLIKKLINNKNWKLILDCDVINCLKFDAEEPRPTFFRTRRINEEKELVSG